MVEAQTLSRSEVFFPLLCFSLLPLGVSPVFYCPCSLFLSTRSPVVLSSPLSPSGCWWCTVSGNQGNWPEAQSQGLSKSNRAIFSAACRETGRRCWNGKKRNEEEKKGKWRDGRSGLRKRPCLSLNCFKNISVHVHCLLHELGLGRLGWSLSASVSAHLRAS